MKKGNAGKNKDELCLEGLRDIRFSYIKSNVSAKKPIFEYELEFVRRITLKEDCIVSREAREFFLGDYSSPFLNIIAADLFKCDGKEILGEYYDFISKENYDTQVPFYKLTLYKGKYYANLKTYTSTITARYFTKKKKKHQSIKIVSIDDGQTIKQDIYGGDVIDNPWFELLINENASKDEIMEKRISNALSKLPEREQLVLKLVVMDDTSGLEAFEDLAAFLHPQKLPLTEWSDKQKQDAVSLLRGRALKHLKSLYYDEENNF